VTSGAFDLLQLEVERSHVWRGLRALAAAYTRALPSSQTSRAAAALKTALPGTRREQLRYAATTAVAALIAVKLMSALWVRDYAASGLPWFWSGLVAAFLVALAAQPDAYLRAWPASSLARLVRRCW
jgi:hypothetical protein